ncbi:hypothetical protein BDZ94DRAFT_1286503 [Collybia nuda]|uniref:BSD domain-containing protein n=1 Tax=Collybia nuda TaxID=64659 RepID=A0A9P5YJM2_9AGAR|nr:hypothetical protein BDZ94DRAFT_1286503 [Collybia nuda]
MNFLDTYDIAGPSTTQAQPEQSLHEEVSEVIGSLGRFWGGFRKQSQTVFQSAVSQAQQELNKLKSDTGPSDTTESNTQRTVPEDGAQRESDVPAGESQPEPEPSQPTPITPQTSPASTTTQTLFTRLQLALPPSIVTTVTNNLPESLKHASENIDFGQLRSNMLTEFQRVQGVTRTQAEEYAHKSEALLREAVKEAGEVIRDAVKIIPPEDTQRSSLVWDGTDMWSLPEASETALQGQIAPSKPQRGTADAQLAVATRAEALLKRLKHDPAIIRHDPEADPGLKELYLQWISLEVETKEGGIEGEEWTAKIQAFLDEPGSGLRNTRDILVPAEITSTAFWTRYLFRVHQIETEEGKRKQLIQGALDDDDFSWEDDEEEAPSSPAPHVAPKQLPKDASSNLSNVPSDTSISTHATVSTTTRQSSEDSFDVVSSRIASPSAHEASNTVHDDSEDPDSDWE